MSTSPYKKLKTANNSWVGYISLSKLAQNRCYKMLYMDETTHSTYGKGQQVTLEACDGQKFRAQMPGKYLAQLSPEDLNQFKTDITAGKNPYLIYRETMIDKSFRIDIVEKSEENDAYYADGTDVPELEDSMNEAEVEVINNEIGANIGNGGANQG